MPGRDTLARQQQQYTVGDSGRGGRSVSRDASGFAPCSPGPEAPARLRSEDVRSRRGASRVPRQSLSSSRSHQQSLPHPADASLSRSPYILLRSSPCRPRSSCRLRPSVSRPLAAPPVSSASRLYRSPTGPPLAHWRAPTPPARRAVTSTPGCISSQLCPCNDSGMYMVTVPSLGHR